MLRMLYGKLLDNLAWDLYVASTVCVPPSTVKSLVTLGRLYFIAKCSVLELLVKFLSKSAEAYPADFNINLILLAMSIFVVHIYACSNTISWQLLYLCLNVVLGFYFWWSTFFFFFFYFSRLFWFFFIIIIIFLRHNYLETSSRSLSFVNVQMWSRLLETQCWLILKRCLLV